MKRFHLVLLLALVGVAVPLGAKDTPAEDYQKRVTAADLPNHPERNRDLAVWCKKNFPEKQALHEQAYNEFQFAQLEKSLPAEPLPSRLQEMATKADELGLSEKAKEYRSRWGTKQFAALETKIKGDDPATMKKLLTWAETQSLVFIEPCQALCRRIVAKEPDYAPARRALGQFQFKGEWTDFDSAVKQIHLKTPAERMELHRALSTTIVPKQPQDFPSNPYKGWTKNGGYWIAATKRAAPYFVWSTGYNRNTPCPLVIDLHGGGEGGEKASREAANSGITMWIQSKVPGSWVVLGAVARNHVSDSWHWKNNFDDIMDAVGEIRERFNIDMTRLYVTGQSMGAGGAGAWLWYFPELAAATCARAGAYGENNPKDVLKKPIMIIHGEKDEAFRNESRDAFVKKTQSIGGVVENISYPDQNHFIKADLIFPKMIPFFQKYRSECPPDLRLINVMADIYLRKK